MSALPDQPPAASRNGRAADALIASYVRELLADDELDAPRPDTLRSEPLPGPAAAAPEGTAAEATL